MQKNNLRLGNPQLVGIFFPEFQYMNIIRIEFSKNQVS